MKIIIGALNAKFVHSNLAIRYIKQYCSEYDIELFETSINDNLLEISMDIIDRKPDILAFSCYIWNIDATIKVCGIVREVLKDTVIILGGPEVSYYGREYLEEYKFIDYIIAGEGEIIFKSLLNEIISGEKKYKNIDGLIFRNDEGITENKGARPIVDLDKLSFPYENEIPDKIVYYEASRGCPFGCSYCLSGGAQGVRFFSLDRVKKDLKYLIDNDVALVKFVDRTFNANKKFALEIWKFLIENHRNTKFHFEIAADLLDDNMISLLAEAPKDLFQFEAGIQTTNDQVLKNINRIMDFNKVRENLLKISKNGNIHCHVDLIAGLPGESLKSFINSFEMCMKLRPDVLQLGFLKVLKGSSVFNESVRYGIHYVKSPNYQVLYTSDISYEEMRELTKFEKVFEIYYNSGIFKMSLGYLFKFKNSIYEFFREFTIFLEERGFFLRNIDLKDKFKMLYDFAEPFSSEVAIKDIMIHDFIINTKKSVLPDFLKKEYSGRMKNVLYENRELMVKYFGEYEPKRLFSIPVNIKVLNSSNNQVYFYKEEGDAILVCSLASGEYCYL